jgi:hypothetical protein
LAISAMMLWPRNANPEKRKYLKGFLLQPFQNCEIKIVLKLRCCKIKATPK